MSIFIRFRIPISDVPRFVESVKLGMKLLQEKNPDIDCDFFQCNSELENFIVIVFHKQKAHKKRMGLDVLKVFLEQINGFKSDILEMRAYQEL